MATEVIVALIAAGGAVAGGLLTFAAGRNSRRTNSRLEAEIAKLQAETEQLRADLDDSRRRERNAEQLALEAERQRQQTLEARRGDIYPEVLELVYRLRNGFRECVSNLRQDDGRIGWRTRAFPREQVYKLTENLYKYRAFIDEATFDLLHRYKHVLQDAAVVLDRITRAPHSREEREGDDEAFATLERMFNDVDHAYDEITKRIKTYVDRASLR